MGIKKLIFGKAAQLRPEREKESHASCIGLRNGRGRAAGGRNAGSLSLSLSEERESGVEGRNHLLTVRTTTGNWLLPYPK